MFLWMRVFTVQITVQKYTPNKRRGKKLSRYPPSCVIDIHFGEHSREHNGQRGDIIYRGEQYGIRRANTGSGGGLLLLMHI